MKKTLGLLGMGLLAALLVSCSAGPPPNYTISGELIVIENGSAEAEVEPRLDSSTASAAVLHVINNSEGEFETVELESGSFADGSVALTGAIDGPTVVRLYVAFRSQRLFATPLLLTPDEEIRFVVLDYPGSYPGDQLALVGSSRTSSDPTRKFLVTGDLSALEADLPDRLIARVTGGRHDGGVLLEDGKFLIESDIDEPQLLYLVVEGDKGIIASARLVVEPNSGFTVSPVNSVNTRELLATSGTGLHAKLVESWQQSEEYLSKLDEYNSAIEKYLAEAGTENNESVAEHRDEPSESVAAAGLSSLPAEGCEHLADDIESSIAAAKSRFNDTPERFRLLRELDEIRFAVLQEIAMSTEDPMEALLAMELGAFGHEAENLSDGLLIYDRISEQLDEDIVARRVTPKRERLVATLESAENNRRLALGQRAPEFSLVNLQGTEVALYDVLAEEELVLIDFWASWCSPCIENFPEMKTLYAAYREHGLEILGVSIDSMFENWEAGSIEHELPWLNLGDMDGWDAATVTSYGVLALPKRYLLDSKGCILDKDLPPRRLKEILVARYGEVSEPAETSPDS